MANSGIHQHWVGLLPDGAETAGNGGKIGIAARNSLAMNNPAAATALAPGAGRSFAG